MHLCLEKAAGAASSCPFKSARTRAVDLWEKMRLPNYLFNYNCLTQGALVSKGAAAGNANLTEDKMDYTANAPSKQPSKARKFTKNEMMMAAQAAAAHGLDVHLCVTGEIIFKQPQTPERPEKEKEFDWETFEIGGKR